MDRPKCNLQVPELKQPKEILERLLAIELDRLEIAVRIEKERSIVFPETSIIIRDIMKLQEALTGKKVVTGDDPLADILSGRADG